MKLKTMAFQNKSLIIFCAFLIFLLIPAAAYSAKDSPIHIQIKLKDLDKLMSLADELSTSTGAIQGVSPTAIFKMMFQGTHWIDPIRSIVMGFTLKNDSFSGAILIPFLEKNENFQSSTKAIARDDYYLIGIPTQADFKPAKLFEAKLFGESIKSAATTISMNFLVADLVREGKKKLPEVMAKMDSLPNTASPSMPIGKDDLKEMIQNIMETFSQMDEMGLTMDIANRDLKFGMSVDSAPKTPLSKLFMSAGDNHRMNAYKPTTAISYRCKSFDLPNLMSMFHDVYGKMGQKIGVDFGKLAEVSSYFTGENAGGISFKNNQMEIESIYALKKGIKGETFLAETYFPWMKNYFENMSGFYKTNLGIAIDNPVTLIPPTMVDGHKVMGMRYKIPNGFDPKTNQPILVESTIKAAVTKEFLVTASNDATIENLIQTTQSFKSEKDTGPFIKGKMDLSAYLRFAMSMVQAKGMTLKDLPNLGEMAFEATMKDGSANLTSVISLDDIKRFTAYTQSLRKESSSAVAQTSLPDTRMEETVDETPMEEIPVEEEATFQEESSFDTYEAQKIEPIIVKDADWYLNQGGLFATYGNYKAAIRQYKKAIEMEPSNSMAFFNMGIAYGESGAYDTAIVSIERAIELNPKNASFYYGRARIYLMMGKEELAMEDFNKASTMGNKNAKEYLATQ